MGPTTASTMARGMAAWLLVLVLGCGVLAVPIQDGPRQWLLNGKGLPPKDRTKSDAGTPYGPEYRDPYDGAVDSVGKKLDPLPWRNGLGASVLGPWNRLVPQTEERIHVCRDTSCRRGSASQ